MQGHYSIPPNSIIVPQIVPRFGGFVILVSTFLLYINSPTVSYISLALRSFADLSSVTNWGSLRDGNPGVNPDFRPVHSVSKVPGRRDRRDGTQRMKMKKIDIPIR
jgi:hypothetical protein